jgi:hypothetical protein
MMDAKLSVSLCARLSTIPRLIHLIAELSTEMEQGYEQAQCADYPRMMTAAPFGILA